MGPKRSEHNDLKSSCEGNYKYRGNNDSPVLSFAWAEQIYDDKVAREPTRI